MGTNEEQPPRSERSDATDVEELRARLTRLEAERDELESKNKSLENIVASGSYRWIPYRLAPVGTLLVGFIGTAFGIMIATAQYQLSAAQEERASSESQRAEERAAAEARRAELQGISGFLDAIDESPSGEPSTRHVIATYAMGRLITDDGLRAQILAVLHESEEGASPALSAAIEATLPSPGPLPTGARSVPDGFFSNVQTARVTAARQLLTSLTERPDLLRSLCHEAANDDAKLRNYGAMWNLFRLLQRAPANAIESAHGECSTLVARARPTLGSGPRTNALVADVQRRLSTAAGGAPTDPPSDAPAP